MKMMGTTVLRCPEEVVGTIMTGRITKITPIYRIIKIVMKVLQFKIPIMKAEMTII